MILSMIVKNEAHCIRRCLESVRPHISSYIICDTGSTDSTIAIIRSVLGITGEIFQHTWKDFGTNRNIALSLCNTKDFVLNIDADEVLEVSRSLILESEYDGYYVTNNHLSTPNEKYPKIRIFKPNLYRYVGMTHEYLNPITLNLRTKNLLNVNILSYDDSARRKSGTKFTNDIEILEKEEPKTPRSWFYLGRSYKDVGQKEKALHAFQNRIKAGGWVEEIYLSFYYIAQITHSIEDYLKAWNYRQERLEALVELCTILRQSGQHTLSYYLSENKERKTNDILFVDRTCEWRILEENAIAAWNIGYKNKAKKIFEEILYTYALDEVSKPRILKNLSYC